MPSEDRPGQVQRFVRSISADRPDSLNFIHVLLPHTPWQYLPTGEQYTPPAGKEVPGVDDNGIWTKDPALPQQAFQRELLQVGYVDRLLGEVIRRLRSQGLYDKAVFILTADHGISFKPGELEANRRGPRALPTVLGVPLFVKAPGQHSGEVDDRHATTADVLPTVADVLGTKLGWPTDGRSLLSDFARPTSDPVDVVDLPEPPEGELAVRRSTCSAATRRWGRCVFREGPGGGWAGVYAMGADSDLFGRPGRAAPGRAGVAGRG